MLGFLDPFLEVDQFGLQLSQFGHILLARKLLLAVSLFVFFDIGFLFHVFLPITLNSKTWLYPILGHIARLIQVIRWLAGLIFVLCERR